MKIVQLRTPDFEADAIFIGDMPAKEVMNISIQREVGEQAYALMKTVRRAILDPNLAAEFDALTFDQMTRVLNEYCTKKPIYYDWED
jgi:hypothetical protein